MTAPDLSGTRIGFVGAGRVGAAMVERLAAHGARLTVYARQQRVRDDLAAQGCRTVDSLAGLADNELVISCLYSDAQLDAIAPELAGLLAPGSTFASHTTGSPTTLRAFAASVADSGVHVVDAPFSGTPDSIRAGTLTVLLGGADPALSQVENAVRSYASAVIRTGDLGSALLLKLVNNLVFAANVQIGLEMCQIVANVNIPIESALAVLEHSSGGTSAMNYLSAFPTAAAFADEVRPFLVKDVAAAVLVAAELGLDLGRLAGVAHGGPMDLSGADS
jgi:3-hydroxyisobutyrate dehydrogenase-like beta-hydroxyacid dehydrogenase